MTTITLNLLAEEQLAEQAQARDPFRITLVASISVVVLTAIAGVLVSRAASTKKQELAALLAKRDGLSSNQAPAASGDTKSLKGVADDLIAINRNRTLYAQQLALIKALVPASIQLVRMNFTLSVEGAEAGVPTDAPAESGSAASKAIRHKPKSTEHLSLQLDGKAISSRPEIEVDQFIKSLRTNPVFSEQVKDIKLRSIARSAPSADTAAAATLPSAAFVIECQYREHR
jgi:hypothetical protein